MATRVDSSSASQANRFTSMRLDRLVEKRDDIPWQRQALADKDTRLVPLWRSRCLLKPGAKDGYEAHFLKTSEIDQLDRIRPPTLLGSDGRHTYFAATINDAQRDEILAENPVAEFMDLRGVASVMSGLPASLLAYAKALHYWQHRHTFCGVCGSGNRLRSGGHRMVCTNDECGRETFPRIDPAIIVLVTHGDACLLGHNPRWAKNRFSTLAGFVEPGESLEDAVAREVFEEAGVRLASIRYRSSQPWPFPASAMAGFYAEATSRDCAPDDDELSEVRWLTPEDIREQLTSRELFISPPVSIAFRLLADWYHEKTGEDLEQFITELRAQKQ